MGTQLYLETNKYYLFLNKLILIRLHLILKINNIKSKIRKAFAKKNDRIYRVPELKEFISGFKYEVLGAYDDTRCMKEWDLVNEMHLLPDEDDWGLFRCSHKLGRYDTVERYKRYKWIEVSFIPSYRKSGYEWDLERPMEIVKKYLMEGRIRVRV